MISGALRTAIYDALTAALSVPVLTQKQTEETEPTPPYVIVPTAPTSPRGDLKRDTGNELTQRIRVHTRYPKGRADLSRREEIAGQVETALEGLEVDGHHILHIPTPERTPQSYDAGGQQAYDLLLDYELKTQTLS